MGSTRAEGDFLVPAGTVTFLLTDVEGSTRAWESDGEGMAGAMVRLDEIISDAIGANAGVRPVEQGEGDSAVAAFAHASDALACALEIQRRLIADVPSVKVRIAIHTGEAQRRDAGNYFGQSIHRAARLRSLAHGGQTLLSRATHDLVLDRLPDGVRLQDVGTHRLRDLSRPEHVYQLCHPDLASDFPAVHSLDSVPNNLPVHLTSFIGREREIAEIRRLLGEGRLLTLTGSGGCGKTRLAAQAAAELLDEHPDGIWWVELAPSDDAQLVPSVVAGACGVKEIAGQTFTETLKSHLREQRALIVLDNCEHLIGACAELAGALLTSCPSLTVLATSRAPIGIEGEVTWRVPSLTLPSEDEPPRIDALTQYEAVRLFIDRAKRARPNFAINDENAPAVAQICHRLNGIPFAIELAAARTRMMGAERILSGLSDRFRLLTGGSRTALPRQQTLEASVDWSHALLSEDERTLLRRLSVFPGDFTLDAAEAVGAAPPIDRYQVLDLLSDLVDKSLVQVEGEERYRLLETVRFFAMRKLDDAGEDTPARDRHLEFYLAFAERAEPELESHDVVEWLVRIDADIANIRAALDWSMQPDRAEAALRLVASLSRYWLSRTHLTESRRRADEAMAFPGTEPRLRCRVLLGSAMAAAMMYEQDAELAMAEEALGIARELGESRLIARALAYLGDAMAWRDPANARPVLDEALSAARASGDLPCLALALVAVSQFELFVGDTRSAAASAREGIAVSRECGDAWMLAMNQIDLAMVALLVGEGDEAERASLDAMDTARRIDERALEGMAFIYLAWLKTMRGQYGEARRLIGEAAAAGGENPISAMGVLWTTATLEYAVEGAMAAGAAHLSELASMQRGGSVALYSMFLAWAGSAHLAAGDPAAASAAFEEAVSLSREPPLPIGLSPGLLGLALLARAEGDLERSEALAHEVLAVSAQGYMLSIPDTLELLAGLAIEQESAVEAARLFGATHTIRERRQVVRYPVNQPAYEADVAVARSALGDEAFQAAWDEGAALSLEEALAYAQRGRGERKRPSSGWGSLTPAELQIVPLVAQHLTNAEIGSRLFMSPSTVKTHLQHIYAKLGLSSRAQVGAEAVRRGLA